MGKLKGEDERKQRGNGGDRILTGGGKKKRHELQW